MKNYDIAIIGSGPGGYVAALRAAHLQKSVCLIERGRIGGTCLNRGCIPTKAYAASRDVLHTVRGAADFGIDVSTAGVDFQRIFARKNQIVKDVRTTVTRLVRGSGIDIIKGSGRLVDENRVSVEAKDGAMTDVRAEHIIIATGSRPQILPFLKVDHESVLTSGDLLKLDTLPEDIVIIGGGIIGCEFASIFNAFGVKITIVELAESILPTIDRQLANIVRRRFKRDGIRVMTGTKVTGVNVTGDTVTLSIDNGDDISAAKALVSVGRAPNTKGIGIDEVGIRLDNGKVVVDDCGRTGVGGIFAIGDVTAGPMLAHKASYDAINAVHSAFGIAPHTVPHSSIPSVVFTSPEIASVGVSEAEAKELSIDYTCGRFSYAASSKALCMNKTEGLIKIVAKKDSGVIIGAAICGARASDMIYGLGVAIDNERRAKDVYKTVFAHPTLCEGIKEALEGIDGMAVHKIVKQR